MAKKKVEFTLAEKQKAVAQIRKRLAGSGRFLTRFNKLSEAEQLEAGEKALRKWAKRSKVGAIDWVAFFESLTKFITALMAILGPLLVKP
jgi:hypothetical protein